MQGLNIARRFCIRIDYLLAMLVLSSAVICGQTTSLPDGPGRDTVQRVCGACHPVSIVLGHGMTREAWGQVVASMITRGAKGSSADFETVTDYLARTLSAKQSGGAAQGRRSLSAGPNDRPTVDTAAAERGKTIYMPDCSSCHGPLARGTANGPDLVRSAVVLHDGDCVPMRRAEP
jgi:mono/diheme cytochrome c family protein